MDSTRTLRRCGLGMSCGVVKIMRLCGARPRPGACLGTHWGSQGAHHRARIGSPPTMRVGKPATVAGRCARLPLGV